MSKTTRRRRTGAIATAIAALSLAFAGTAWADHDRLSGDFALRGAIDTASGDFAAMRGDNIMRDAFFRPVCRRASGACDVIANVEVNEQRIYVVLRLDRRHPGRYRGSARFRIRCGGGQSDGRATFVAHATQTSGGYVTRLRAWLRVRHFAGEPCTGHTQAHLHGQKQS